MTESEAIAKLGEILDNLEHAGQAERVLEWAGKYFKSRFADQLLFRVETEGMQRMLPPFNPTWSDDIAAHWMDALEKLKARTILAAK